MIVGGNSHVFRSGQIGPKGSSAEPSSTAFFKTSCCAKVTKGISNAKRSYRLQDPCCELLGDLGPLIFLEVEETDVDLDDFDRQSRHDIRPAAPGDGAKGDVAKIDDQSGIAMTMSPYGEEFSGPFWRSALLHFCRGMLHVGIARHNVQHDLVVAIEPEFEAPPEHAQRAVERIRSFFFGGQTAKSGVKLRRKPFPIDL